MMRILYSGIRQTFPEKKERILSQGHAVMWANTV